MANKILVIIVLFCAGGLYAGEPNREDIERDYGSACPSQWGETISGIKSELDTADNVIALTFDACGSRTDGFDSELIDYLQQEQLPATLFLGGKWIDKFPQESADLSKNPLFEIENHGLTHKPFSVTGRKAYGIQGTKDPGELYDEIELNARKIAALTGSMPRFVRSGGATYDDVALQIVGRLGCQAVGFSRNGDYGATAPKVAIVRTLLHAPKGSIIIFHMNRPGKGAVAALRDAVPLMKQKGIRFVKLSEYNLK